MYDIVKNDNGLYEKSEIKWFTLDEIKDNKDKFRPFYREIINNLLIYFKT